MWLKAEARDAENRLCRKQKLTREQVLSAPHPMVPHETAAAKSTGAAPRAIAVTEARKAWEDAGERGSRTRGTRAIGSKNASNSSLQPRHSLLNSRVALDV